MALAQAYFQAREYDAAMQFHATLLKQIPHTKATAARRAAIAEEYGRVAMKQHDYEGAERAFMQAFAIVTHEMKHDPDAVVRLRIENFLGQCRLYRNAVDLAIQTFEQTDAAAQMLPVEQRRQITNNDLGVAYYEAGRYDEAVLRCTSDIRIAEACEDLRMAWRARYYLGHSYRAREQYAEAATEYAHALELAKKGRDLEQVINAYTGLANVAGDQKQFADAITFYERALDLCPRLGDDERTAGVATSLGACCCTTGAFARAETSLFSALAILSQTTRQGKLHQRYRCSAHLELAELYRKQQQFVRARHHLEEAATLAQQYKNCAAHWFWVYLQRIELTRDEGHPMTAKKWMPQLRQHAVTEHQQQLANEVEATLSGTDQ